MKRLIASAVVCMSVVAVATGDEITGYVTKFEDGKITFRDIKAGYNLAKKGVTALEPITLPVASNAKFLSAKFKGINFEVEGDYPGGKEAFAKAVKDAEDKWKAVDKDKKDETKAKGGKTVFATGGFIGVFAHIVTEGDGDKAQITEIRVVSLPNKK